jgi:hypothetical protein
MRAASVGLALALVTVSACKDDPPAKPSFEAGPEVERELAQLGGVKLTAPDNLKISEAAGEATLAAEGFPTITITHSPGEYDSTGTRASTSMGDVRASYTIPSAEWSCTADDAGDHTELVVDICESLRAPERPNVAKLTCKTVDGFDAAAVGPAWSATGPAFVECLGATEMTGLAFGFNYELREGGRNFTTYTSPIVKDAEVSACLSAIYDALEDHEALARGEREAGQIECDGQYSRF